MPAFDLIIFDCDGVLVDSELLARRALQSVFREGGIEVDAALAGAIVGMKFADALAFIEGRTGRSLDPRHHARFWPETEELFAAHLQATAGLAEFLRASPLPRCVASSSHHARIRRSLSIAGLAGFFAEGDIFSSQDVAHGKPAPDLFLHAARSMGAEPARCLVIEDTHFGILGAKAAGMTAFGFLGGAHLAASDGDELEQAGADFVARSWPEIAARLALAGKAAG